MDEWRAGQWYTYAFKEQCLRMAKDARDQLGIEPVYEKTMWGGYAFMIPDPFEDD